MERYNSREIRLERLQRIEEDLRLKLQQERERQLELQQRLEKNSTLLSTTSHNGRHLYQEVDMQDSALAAARKEAEDAKEKEYYLRVNIDNIKRAIARFLSKVTKTPCAVATNDQVFVCLSVCRFVDTRII